LYVAAAVMINPIVFYSSGMCRRHWRYVGVPDMMAVLFAGSASFVAMGIFVAARLVYNSLFEFSRGCCCSTGC
jgi:FlaA1/EpsC-like NDP-sugar epimerase